MSTMLDGTAPYDCFFAATIGALVSVVFCRTRVPGTENLPTCARAFLTIAYGLLAGYIAVSVLAVTHNYQAFVVGIGLDALLRQLRHRARGWPDSAEVRRESLVDGEDHE